MKPLPPPVDPDVTYVEGYYWMANIKLRSAIVILYQDNWWNHYRSPGEDIGIIEGPLEPPTKAQLAAWPAEFAAEVKRERAHLAHVKPTDFFDWLDGFYWIQWEGKEPEIAYVMEDSWQSLTWIDGDVEWGFHPDINPRVIPVIYGPLVKPKLKRTNS